MLRESTLYTVDRQVILLRSFYVPVTFFPLPGCMAVVVSAYRPMELRQLPHKNL